MDLPECWIKVAVIVKIVGIAGHWAMPAVPDWCQNASVEINPVPEYGDLRPSLVYRNPVLDWHAESRNADAQLWYLI